MVSGLIYRGRRLINWDTHDQTALSDLEVEHEENHKGELLSFAYPIADTDGGGGCSDNSAGDNAR